MGKLSGHQSVVVGATRGHGRASALRLALDGAFVFLVDSSVPALGELLEEISSRGGRGRAVDAETDDHEALVDAAVRIGQFSPAVDSLVNNHVMLDYATVEALDMDRFARVVHHCLMGPVAATKAFLPLLRAGSGGSVVHLGSVDGIYGNPRAASFSAAKGGLVPLTHIMAREFAPSNVRVNAIASCQTNQVDPEVPGARADASADVIRHGSPGPSYFANLSQATPLKRFGPPEDWAGVVSFLVSDDSAYVTGSVVVVDAGRTGLTPGTFPWDSPGTS